MNDNFKCIYKILKALEKALDYLEFDISQIDQNKQRTSITECKSSAISVFHILLATRKVVKSRGATS